MVTISPRLRQYKCRSNEYRWRLETDKVSEFRRGDNSIDHGALWFSIPRHCPQSPDYLLKLRDPLCIGVLINGAEVFLVVVHYHSETWPQKRVSLIYNWKSLFNFLSGIMGLIFVNTARERFHCLL